MYAKVNPTGCTERYGLVQVRLDLCLEAGDVRYDDPRFYQVDQTSGEFLLGYQGLVDKDGQPLDLEAYAAWQKNLPRVWLAERKFHSHFIYLDPYTLRDEQITEAIGLHLPNFYRAWTEERDHEQGGMRHGWDVATRIRPERINKTRPELYDGYRAETLGKLTVLKASLSTFDTQAKGKGETFPSTDIDVGSAATDRGSFALLTSFYKYYTQVDGNNAANDDGAIDTVEAWFSRADADNSIKVGTFSADGNTLTCRDAQSIGEVTEGSKQTYTSLDIDVETGDYIGADARTYDVTGLKKDTSGFTKVWEAEGQYCDPEDSATFTSYADDAISLYGTGETAAATTYTKTPTIDALLKALDSKTVSLDARLRATDAQTVDIDALLRDTDIATVMLDAILGTGGQVNVDLDALLRATDSEAVTLDALLKAVDSKSVDLDAVLIDRLIAAINLDLLLRATDSSTLNLDALLAGSGSEQVSIDAILSREEHAAPFYIEVRDPSGDLLGVIKDLLSGSLEQATNQPDVLSFSIPSGELRAGQITRKNELWVRDVATDEVISRCRLQMVEEED